MERFTINRFFTMVMLWSVFVMPASSAKSSEPDTLTFTVDQYQLRWLDAQMKASPAELTQVMTGAFGYDTANRRVIKLTKENILISYSGRTETELVILTR